MLGAFLHDVAGVIDEVGIVAFTADQRVGLAAHARPIALKHVVAGQALEDIAAGSPKDRIGKGITLEIDTAHNGRVGGKIFDIVDKCVGIEFRRDDIESLALELDDLVADILDEVDVVAFAADQRVDASAAVERVLAAEPD